VSTIKQESGTIMSKWPLHPAIYEINTWVWLSAISAKIGHGVDLSSVPAAQWDGIAKFGFEAVWLMGVWERSPACIAISNQDQVLLDDFRRALPDFRPEDNVGSAYSVRRYVVDPHLGGAEGLAAARRELARRGIRLILDFVPNHVAPDHPWVVEHPEYFIRGRAEDARDNPTGFVTIQGRVYARGRDPHFPAWPDVLQLNVFDAGLRIAAVQAVSAIAGQCDGIRCDMAMLVLNTIFERTWGHRAGRVPQMEYWAEVIAILRESHPQFLFIAEAYWDREWDLQQLGFDYCYDKRLYDRLEHGDPESVRLHLSADPAYQRKLVRFIENHDEPRASVAFSGHKEKAAALTAATVPGARLFHEGQFQGCTVRPAVFLGRRPEECPNEEIRSFYEKLLRVVDDPLFHEGEWSLCDCTGWPDNQSFRNLVSWCWARDEDRTIVVVNLTGAPAQGRVHLPWSDLRDGAWRLHDRLSDTVYDHDGVEMSEQGLYVGLEPWKYHLFRCSRAVAREEGRAGLMSMARG
jgi:Alpha amylase, catalytic domain